MANPIEVKLLANTSDLTRGTKDVEGALDKVADSLDDIGKGGKTAGDQLDKSISGASDSLTDLKRDARTAGDELESQIGGAAKNTGRDVEDLEQSFRQLADTQKATTKSVADDFTVTEGQQKRLRKEAVKEIGEEAKANAAETFSSFDGSAQSFVDGVQGTLGGLVSSLGPIGVAAGAAGALAIGLINGVLQKADDQSVQFKTDVGEMTKELIKSGDLGKVSLDYVVGKLQDLATESDASKVSLTKLFEASGKSGSNAKALAQAYAGQVDGLKDLVAAGKEKYEQDQAAADAASKNLNAAAQGQDADSQYAASLQRKAQGQKDYNTYLEDAVTKAKAAALQEKEYVEAGGPELEAKANLIKQVNDAYDEGAGDVDSYIKKESGLLDTNAYIKAMEAKQKALQDYQHDLATLGLSDSAKTFLEAQGADAAATLLAGYKSGSDAQKKKLDDIWNTAGQSNSAEYTGALQSGMSSATIKPPKIGSFDFGDADRRITEWAAKDRTVNVKLTATARNGQRII